MKRILSLVLVGMIIMGTLVVANTTGDLTAVPTLISEEPKSFTIEQDGDEFTIIVSENGSTGYLWSYIISNEELVAYVNEESIFPEEVLPGAPSEKRMTFKSLAEGVSTIIFKYARAFGDEEVAETFTILVYQQDNKVIVEEDQLAHIMDTATPSLYSLSETATYNGIEITADVSVQEINGITMIPLRATLEAMGYLITWIPESKSVEIQKGANWTSIAINKNAYFKNRMAPHELSCAPVIVNSRTLVPIEFFADIIGCGIEVDSQKINFTDNEAIIHSGYVKSITMDETGTKTLTLTSDLSSDSIELQTIIHTSSAYTFYNKEVSEGSYVQVVSSIMMTMSMPGQTSGYVVY